MAGPFTVQPQLDLLYPAKAGFSRKWSENTSIGGNGSKNKSLFQSRYKSVIYNTCCCFCITNYYKIIIALNFWLFLKFFLLKEGFFCIFGY